MEYFDVYLMHAQGADNFAFFKKCHAYETALELMAEGKFRHFGISFHDRAEVLEQILTEYPQIEVVQIQFNYVDYDDSAVESRKCYEVCRKFGKQVIVMEPVKGGNLVNLPENARAVFEGLHGGSPASYAIRFAASFEGIMMVLSGMSDMAQMQDNISFMKDFQAVGKRRLRSVSNAANARKPVRSICISAVFWQMWQMSLKRNKTRRQEDFIMEKRKIGSLEVSAVGLGCMGITHASGTPMTTEEGVKVLRQAFEYGYTLFDTAECYTGINVDGSTAYNEEVVGEALRPFRDKVAIATKCGVHHGKDRLIVDSRPETIRKSVEGSLKRLGTDYIDLYYQHRIDPQVSPEEVAGTMAELIREGKIRYWGISEVNEDYLRRAHAVCPARCPRK